MAYRMSEDKDHFAVLNLCNTHNSGNIACFIYSVFTHKLESAPVGRNERCLEKELSY